LRLEGIIALGENSFSLSTSQVSLRFPFLAFVEIEFIEISGEILGKVRHALDAIFEVFAVAANYRRLYIYHVLRSSETPPTLVEG
jgi:hypothetical protein